MLSILFFIFKCSCHSILASSINNYIELNDQNCFNDQNYNFRLSYSSPLCIYRCKFQSIRGTYKGGAIYISYSTIKVQINHFESCIFTNCFGSEGGALYISTTQLSNTEIINCTFDNNSANTYGGVISLNTTIFKLFECHFLKNGINVKNSPIFGGVLNFWTSQGTIEFCKFINNYSSFILSLDKSLDSFGGVVYFYKTNTTFDQCIFGNNTIYTSKKSGMSSGYITRMNGAVITITSSKCNFTNSCFENNKGISDDSITTGPFTGCSIYANKSSIINVEFCNFSNNLLYEVGVLSIIHGMSGVGAYLYQTNSTFLGCKFNNNTSYSYDKSTNCGISSYGAAVTLHYSYGSFDNCDFINNSMHLFATSTHPSLFGGAIYSNRYETNIKYCNFYNNSAHISGKSEKVGGGAVYIFGGLVKKCCFSDNTAINGGHICYQQNNVSNYKSHLVVDECSFMTTHNDNGYMKSLFYITSVYNFSFANSFINNALYFTNAEKLFLFNGTFVESRTFNYTSNRYDYTNSTLKFSFINNCISSYDGINFKSDSFHLLDENAEKNASFELSFNSICTKIKNNCHFYFAFEPSKEFTQSDHFTESNMFLNEFSKTKLYENKDTNENKSKSKHLEKTILLSCITCIEVILIALVIVLIIIIAKINRNQRLIEPLMNESE